MLDKILNQINVEKSIHTKQLQFSDFVKLDDNVLNYSFRKHRIPFVNSSKTDEELMDLKEDLNRVQVKYLKDDQIKKKHEDEQVYVQFFMKQIQNLRLQGNKLDEMETIDKFLNKKLGEGKAANTLIFDHWERKLNRKL